MGRLEIGVLTRDLISQVLHPKIFPYPLLEFLKVWYVLVYKFSKENKVSVECASLQFDIAFNLLFWSLIDIFVAWLSFINEIIFLSI